MLNINHQTRTGSHRAKSNRRNPERGQVIQQQSLKMGEFPLIVTSRTRPIANKRVVR